LTTASWQKDAGFSFTPPQSSPAWPSTPLFDGTNVYAADDKGNVFALSQTSGGQSWTQSLGGATSGPVLLQDGSLPLVQADGTVKIASAAGVQSLVKTPSFSSGTPVVPAVDARGAFGVAYV